MKVPLGLSFLKDVSNPEAFRSSRFGLPSSPSTPQEQKKLEQALLIEPEYFIQWKNYSSTENTWEPPEHLPEDLIAAFERRSVDPVRIDECRERLALLFEKDLKAILAGNETIVMRHDVMRALFPGFPSDQWLPFQNQWSL